MKYPTFFGIDLTSTPAKPSACLGLDDKSQLVYLGFLAENSDIVALMNFYSPQVIAIDAPLSLPLGLCCLEDNCSCQPEFPAKKSRQCDRELRRQGIPCYPTSKRTFIRRLIYRGIQLKTAIASWSAETSASCRSEEMKRRSQIIEVYPYASKVRLFGRTMPKKATRQGITFLRGRLGDILPALRPYLGGFGHDLCDAVIAAYTALLFHQNMVDALGSSEEGLIFIPH